MAGQGNQNKIWVFSVQGESLKQYVWTRICAENGLEGERLEAGRAVRRLLPMPAAQKAVARGVDMRGQTPEISRSGSGVTR